MVAVTTTGRTFTVRGAEIEEANNRVRGADATSIFDMEAGERILALVAGGSERLVMVTAGGIIKRIDADEVLATPPQSPLIALAAGDRVACAFTAPDEADLVVAADDGRAVRMEASSVRVQRRGAAGMAGIKLREGSVPVGAGGVAGDPVLMVATSAPGAGAASRSRTARSCLPGQGSAGRARRQASPGESVVAAAVGAADGMLALMGQDDNPRKIDPHPVPVRVEPTARNRSPQRFERSIHVLAPGRW